MRQSRAKTSCKNNTLFLWHLMMVSPVFIPFFLCFWSTPTPKGNVTEVLSSLEVCWVVFNSLFQWKIRLNVSGEQQRLKRSQIPTNIGRQATWKVYCSLFSVKCTLKEERNERNLSYNNMAKATWRIKVIFLVLFWTNLISNLSECYLTDKRYSG